MMSFSPRRTLVITLPVVALLAAGAGIASAHDHSHHHAHNHKPAKVKHLSTTPESSSPYANDTGDSHHPYGTGSGLSGGPTQTQVLPNGEAPVPLQDPTLGEGTVLPPGYNALAGATG